jgi:hypothetical protein
VNQQASEKTGTIAREPQDDRSAKRVADDVGRRPANLIDQRREVGDVFADAPLRCQALAPTMPAAIVGQHAEVARERGHDSIPVVMVAPRAVHQHHEVAARSRHFPEQLHAVDRRDRHMGT